MKSSTGAYFIAFDHVRALATFMVVTWHFCHSQYGYPVDLSYVPFIFPFVILDEGHTGVALFMTLSGYLFARLLEGKSIDFAAFLWNRAVRLIPLLTLVLVILGIQKWVSGDDLNPYLWSVLAGPILPSLPHGGWSITAEFHCYLVLPLLLLMLRRFKYLPFLIVVLALLIRWAIYRSTGEVQILAYSIIVGRIDPFVFGVLACHFRTFFTRKHFLVGIFLIGFFAYYWYFNFLGGFYLNQGYPSASALWIFLPTVEGITYAIAIAWYESSFSFGKSWISKWIAQIGGYSYSIYLLHFFFVNGFSTFVHEQVMDISNFYLACAWSALFFLLMVPLGYLSFRLIESPFLKLRKPYLHPALPDGKIFWQPSRKISAD